jgi:hypothetical protein
MRRIARFVPVHRTTVARKLRFLGEQSALELRRFRETQVNLAIVQFDELETFEHTKYKPLSVVVAVLPRRRKILGVEVASMPAKGPLAERARRTYGRRADRRGKALDALFASIRPCLVAHPTLQSDSSPRYPPYVRRHFPHARHVAKPGGRGCVTGQGEIKAERFDPLFDLNHTFAMLRDNVRRLVRRTWCTTKKADCLAHHLALYADFHNRVLT